MAAVNFARESELDLAVRGGGHSVPGFGTVDDGVVIDLSGMRTFTVDPETRTARAQGGATWGDFNDATHAHGLATTGGVVSTTGVGGLTLGGGIGYLARGFGLSCDNLLSAEVVTADGQSSSRARRRTRISSGPSAAAAGTSASSTSFEFRLHPVKDIYGGPMFFELDDAGDVLRSYREFIADAPEEFGGFPAWQIAPPLPFIPEERHGETFLAFVACWAGPLDEGESVARSRCTTSPRSSPSMSARCRIRRSTARSTRLSAGAPALLEGQLRDRAHRRRDRRASRVRPQGPGRQLDDAHLSDQRRGQRVASDATAFAYRDATFATVIAGMWPDPAENEANIKWVRDYYEATAPHSEEGGYINFMSEDDQDRIRPTTRATTTGWSTSSGNTTRTTCST